MTTTSGRSAAAASIGLLPVRGLADDLDPLLVGQDHPEPGPDELLVVDEEHAHGHVALTVAPRSAAGR